MGMRPDSPSHSKGFGKWGATGPFIAVGTGKGKRLAPYPTGTGEGKGKGGAIGPSTKEEMWEMSFPDEMDKRVWAGTHPEETDHLETLDFPSLLAEVHEAHLLISNILAQPLATPLPSPWPLVEVHWRDHWPRLCPACMDEHKVGCDFRDCARFNEMSICGNKVRRMRGALSKIDYILKISRHAPPIPCPSSSSTSADP